MDCHRAKPSRISTMALAYGCRWNDTLATERLQDYTCKQISFRPKVIRLKISKGELWSNKICNESLTGLFYGLVSHAQGAGDHFGHLGELMSDVPECLVCM